MNTSVISYFAFADTEMKIMTEEPETDYYEFKIAVDLLLVDTYQR